MTRAEETRMETKRVEWEREAQEALESLCRIWPSVTGDRWREKITRIAVWKAAFEGKSTITREFLWNCAREVVPKTYASYFYQEDDPKGF